MVDDWTLSGEMRSVGDDNGWLKIQGGEGSLFSTSIIPQHGRCGLILCSVVVRTALIFSLCHFWIEGIDSSHPLFYGARSGFCFTSINDTLGIGVAEASCMSIYCCHD